MTDELTQAAMTTWAAKDLPARLLAAQVAKLLKCTPEDVAILVTAANGIATRTWQNAIEALIATKQGANQHRWQTAAKDKVFVPLMPRIIIDTSGELLLKVMQTGTVSTNVYLRRLHNLCVDMNWLPWQLKLGPLGRPNTNAVKFFSAVELMALLADREWLD
jgi:hypothetical protein